ncbi:UNVERIFIED_ORG: GNAT superfamily N-acetyltransferase [Rhizobium esperanzae]
MTPHSLFRTTSISVPNPTGCEMTLKIRDAVRADAATILRFIRELAVYERAEHEVEATIETLTESLFGEGSVTHALICEKDGEAIGSAIWFFNYSTWQARKGVYLEDLYVTPTARGLGAGKALLRRLAEIALENNCGRFEWSVLDWNEPTIKVYEAIGAQPMKEWVRYRLSGEKLSAFAAG